MENQIKKDANASGEFWGTVLFYYCLTFIIAAPVIMYQDWKYVHDFGDFLWWIVGSSIKTLTWIFWIWF